MGSRNHQRSPSIHWFRMQIVALGWESQRAQGRVAHKNEHQESSARLQAVWVRIWGNEWEYLCKFDRFMSTLYPLDPPRPFFRYIIHIGAGRKHRPQTSRLLEIVESYRMWAPMCSSIHCPFERSIPIFPQRESKLFHSADKGKKIDFLQELITT